MSTKRRVLFAGTPAFAVPALNSLAAASDEFEIVGVYTQPDRPVGRGLELSLSPVKKRALELSLSVCQPEKLSLPGEFEKMKALSPEILVVVAFGQILKPDILSLPPLGCINIHSSLLPRWRGAAPIQRAILEGDRETGVTTMKLVDKLDAGDILLQAKTPIDSQETAGSLHDRLAQLGAVLLLPTLRGLFLGSISPQKQDESKVTYAAKLTKEMEVIDSATQSAEVLDRKIRALNPWPGISIWVEGKDRLKIRRAFLRSDIQGRAGWIFEKNGMVLLGTPQGSLELQLLQWDGKKEVDAGSFLNGLRGRGKQLPLEISSHLT